MVHPRIHDDGEHTDLGCQIFGVTIVVTHRIEMDVGAEWAGGRFHGVTVPCSPGRCLALRCNGQSRGDARGVEPSSRTGHTPSDTF